MENLSLANLHKLSERLEYISQKYEQLHNITYIYQYSWTHK